MRDGRPVEGAAALNKLSHWSHLVVFDVDLKTVYSHLSHFVVFDVALYSCLPGVKIKLENLTGWWLAAIERGWR